MDVMARLVGQHAQASLKQPVIVENRAGAGGALGSKAVAVADPRWLHAAVGIVRHALDPACA